MQTTYRVSADDIDAKLAVRVDVSRNAKPRAFQSEPTAVVLPAAPAVSGLPSITGEAREDVSLSGAAGTWTSSRPVTSTLQWSRCDASGSGCTDIPGASGPHYLLVAEDVGHRVRLRVSASNPGGTATAESAPTDVVAAVVAPSNATLPTVEGSAALTSVLTARPGTWHPEPRAHAYQWLRCDASGSACVPIEGATSPTYAVAHADFDHALAVTVTASNKAGSSSATSAATPAVTFPASCAEQKATVGPLVPSVAETVRGAKAWNDMAWAATADGQSATVTLSPGEHSDALVLKGFGLALPSQARVKGLEVLVTRSSAAGARIEDVSIGFSSPGYDALLKPVSGAPWPAESRTVVFGGPTDLWASPGYFGLDRWRTIATALNSPDFAVSLHVRHRGGAGDDLARIDGVQVRVYYTTASMVGPASPTTVVDDASRGTVAWLNPQEAASPAAPAATVTLQNDASHYLKATNFGLALPAGKTPSGVLLQFVRSSGAPAFFVVDDDIRLVKSGAAVGQNQANFSSTYTATLTKAQYGNATDLWGVTLSAAEIASPNFGVAISARNIAGMPLLTSVDGITLSVLYDPVDVTATGTASSVSQQTRSIAWFEPSNALSVDGSSAISGGLTSDRVSDELVLRSFGFSLPPAALISGIQIDVVRSTQSASYTIEERRVQLVAGGTRRGLNLADDSSPWENATSTVQYGGPSERWGTFWEVADVNDPGFGVTLSTSYVSNGGNDSARVDGVTATVTYCLPQ
ncbi:hypothetical protein [Archangium sp. Cb G35]|uniref:hypothetical protein n=1 Tax=Archangium sp. Cb G35 TaxID=1920190 RepID=UPI001160F1C4|nr:hypothetical protein [Archangium sp. Cb G35]